MNSVTLWVSWRPIRVAFCLPDNDLTLLTKAFELAHTMWGGRFCPIVPTDHRDRAINLVRKFDVDVLLALDSGRATQDVLAEFPHLRWRDVVRHFSVGERKYEEHSVLTVRHPIHHLSQLPPGELSEMKPVLPQWDEKDPLRPLWLAWAGGFPPNLPEFKGPDLNDMFLRELGATKISLTQNVPGNFPVLLTPNNATSHHLWPQDSYKWNRGLGLFVGASQNFFDLVSFWNLRATGLNLAFFDPAVGDRLDTTRKWYLHVLAEKAKRSSRPKRAPVVWSLRDRELPSDVVSGEQFVHRQLNFDDWPPQELSKLFFRQRRRSVLANIERGSSSVALSFGLPDGPFFEELVITNRAASRWH